MYEVWDYLDCNLRDRAFNICVAQFEVRAVKSLKDIYFSSKVFFDNYMETIGI